jgi:hypothetical protein
MDKKFCTDERKDKHGRIVASCSLAPHTDPEHVDMHSGRSWFNIPRSQVEPVRAMLALAEENSALGLVDKPSEN